MVVLRCKETQTAFKISFLNWFQPLQELIEDSETDIQTQWEHSSIHVKTLKGRRPNTRSASLPIPSTEQRKRK
jgi:hypothetical protein